MEEYKISVRLYARKAVVPIENIVIPKNFGTPNPEKIIKHCQGFFGDYDSLDPILVDEGLILIDGYISLLVLQAIGRETARVFKIMPRVKAVACVDTLPETCPHCGYIEVRDWKQDDGFCPNCGDRILKMGEGEQNG